MRRSVLPALVLVIAGCSMLGPRTFELTLPKVGDFAPLPVRLTDVSGTVTAIDLQPPGPPPVPLEDAVRSVAGRGNVVLIEWAGGACDELVEIELEVAERTTFTLTTHHGMGGCFAAPIQRRLLVVFATPVDAGTMDLETVFVPTR